MVRQIAAALGFALALTACATSPAPRTETVPPRTQPSPPSTPPVAVAQGPIFTLRAVEFAALPGWQTQDPRAALTAFRASCRAIANRSDDQALGRLAPYGGTVGDWRGVCAGADIAADARAFLEFYFTPHEVVARSDQMRRLTGYYEPVVQARRAASPGVEEPFLARPADLVGIDLSQFDAATDLSQQITDDVMRGLVPVLPDDVEPRAKETLDDRLERRFQTPIWGRLTTDRRVIPFAARSEIDRAQGVLGYARACDVYDVQVQGSARVQFEDGAQMRMAYAAQNGWRWNSIYGQLRTNGAIRAANKASVCAYLGAQTPEGVRAALNLDPSYVFFSLEPLGDPNAGPRGAQGVSLTALGSMAVDPAAHPYGAVLFVATDDGAFARTLVAQDTGGAIRRGPLRGDVFFGTGDEAGAQAERMNAPARFYTLLPKTLAAQLVAMR